MAEALETISVDDVRFEKLAPRYVAKTKQSKQLAERYRHVLTDIRSSNRFRPEWKELVYPIACARSSGSRLWDVDDNEYVDLTMGFGVHLFGHSPAFIVNALGVRLETGSHLGAENELPGTVADLISEFTGLERVAFVNTGSEAVLTALRLARAATGRSKIAVFENSYHGWFDGVLAQRVSRKRTAPMAPGITSNSVRDVIVLEYNSSESLRELRAVGPELAAVLVEPIQVRNPGAQPHEFLQALREVTQSTGTALIFDEMVTGFRVRQGGAQELYGIRADIATYGKVLAGGMPIGVVAGAGRFLDPIDGGVWAYGDRSLPGAQRTIFAGTFSRHPLAMAAAHAVLGEMKRQGPALQDGLNTRATALAAELTRVFEEQDAPFRIHAGGSMIRIAEEDEDLRELLWYHLIHRGVFVCEARTWFLSTAHDPVDCNIVVEAMADAIIEMKGDGCFG